MSLEAAQSDFNAALEGLYHVFAPYPFRANMECCIPHCFEQSEIDALGAKPLRLLEERELSSFACSLLLTCGEVEDFKHFLPRLFELTATSGLDLTDAEIVIGKLGRAEWRTWPVLEQAAVNEFLDAWWQLELERDDLRSLEHCFSALCCMDNDPRVFLTIWRDSAELRDTVKLARFITYNLTMILIGRNFDQVSPEATAALKALLLGPETRARLEAAFFECDDPDDRETLSFAEQLLR